MAVAATLALTGCQQSNAAAEAPKIPSYAISQQEDTSLGRALAADVKANPGKSGFRVLETGSESFSMRLALVRAAEKTLDLQYYSIHDDTTANLLVEALVRAARRGVRIRFLLDNINLNEVQTTFSVLDGFKNLEIRVFNPPATRDDGPMGPVLAALTDFDGLNRRMHNKALIADNQMGIIGGRNLGDEYFEEHTDVTFKDVDILTAGPITAQISHSFDTYWNSKEAVPIGQLLKPKRDKASVEKIRGELADHWNEVLATPKGKKLLESKLHERLKDADVRMVWAPAELTVDEPQKADSEQGAVQSKPMARLDRLLTHAKKEFIAVSPYFVPRPEGVEWLAGLVKRGIKVKVVTNSLASTDVVVVHTGYKPYREALVDSGIELYETKPIEGKRPRQRLIGSKAPAQASLHAKVYVVDREQIMIGSFNLDPRSIWLNTEIAVVIHSPEIAAQVVKMFDEVTAPDSSYHVMRSPDTGKLVWRTQEKGKQVDLAPEPDAGLWRSLQMHVMELLPVEDKL